MLDRAILYPRPDVCQPAVLSLTRAGLPERRGPTATDASVQEAIVNTLEAGYGRHRITPPLGIPMAGYAARKEGCRGVYDDLFVTALGLSDGSSAAVVLAFDVLSFNRTVTAGLKAAVRAATGLEDAAIVLNTSHTHAGPRLAPREPTPATVAYVAAVQQAAAAAAAAALAARRPAQLRVGAAPLAIGANRRQRQADGRIVLGVNPAGPTLPEVTVWELTRADADRIVLFSAPFHGVTMGSDNLYISAEWMGAAVRELERRTPGLKAMFLQGCAGNQNVTRERGGFAQVTDHGTTAAGAVTAALAGLRPVSAVPLRTYRSDVPVPLRDGTPFPVSCHGLRLGAAAMVGLGGEAFVEYALHGRQASPFTSTLILGYTDAVVGYLAVAETYAEGGYEAEANQYFETGQPWSPEIEGLLKRAITDALSALARD